MNDRRPQPAGARGAFGIGVLVAIAVILYLLLSESGTEADYQNAVDRFGQEPIDRLVTATTPLGIVKHCIERFGEDEALIDAVSAYNARNEEAMEVLIAELQATAEMSDDEKRAIEATVMQTVAVELPDAAACADARQRIESGALDLPDAPPPPGGAQVEGN